MIALIRELINILYPFTSNLQNNQLELSKHYSIDIETDFSIDHSISPSINSLRKTSANFAIFSIDYVKHIQAQADNLTWAEQVKNRKIQSPFLFHVTMKNVIIVTTSMKLIVKPIHVSHTVETNNEIMP